MSTRFLWGGSTSAFQFEGGGHEGNKGLSLYDIREKRQVSNTHLLQISIIIIMKI